MTSFSLYDFRFSSRARLAVVGVRGVIRVSVQGSVAYIFVMDDYGQNVN